MATINKNLFIIFGTTRGVGKAFYEYASNFLENDFIVVNRKALRASSKNIRNNLVIDLSRPLTKNIVVSLRSLFSQQKNYRTVFLILNASVIEPIKQIGFASDELLFRAGNINFLNYERIINIFISSTRHMSSKKKILAISSGAADSPHIGLSSYCSTKAALEMVIQCLCLEQKRQGKYLAIALRPGVVDTDMQNKMRSSQKENFPQVNVYKKIFKQKKLLNPKFVAGKIYSLLHSDKYWHHPIITIDEIT